MAKTEKRRQGKTSTAQNSKVSKAPGVDIVQDADCPECGGKGGRLIRIGEIERRFVCSNCVEKAEREERRERREHETREKAKVQNYRASNVASVIGSVGVDASSDGHSHCTLNSFEDEHDPDALDAARRFCRTFEAVLDRDPAAEGPPSLYLYSARSGSKLAPGCGKTHLAVGILHELLLTRPDLPVSSCLFVEWPSFLRRVRGAEVQFAYREVSRLAEPSLLVWDDFGLSRPTEFTAELEFMLLNARRGKANVITSNFGLRSLVDRDETGSMERVASRIAGRFELCRMTGPDFRVEQARKKLAQ